MKKLILITAMCSAIAANTKLFATDLVVASSGAGGAYTSINAAIAAASPNDRIIVYPGGSPYLEGTINITKSLQILCANEGAYYAVNGTVNISPATAGCSITIIGMKLLNGGIQSTLAAPTGSRCVVNIINDSIAQGNVVFNHNNYNVTIASSIISSSSPYYGPNYVEGIVIRFGRIIGNEIFSEYYKSIAVVTDGSTNNPNDTIQIIGNKIHSANYDPGSFAIDFQSTQHYFSIMNNFIDLTSALSTSPSYCPGGIKVGTGKNSSVGKNTITNNTIKRPTTYLVYDGIYLTLNSSAITEIYNNLLVGGYYSTSIYAASGSGTVGVSYNLIPVAGFSGVINDGTNSNPTNTTINNDGLNTNPSSNSINGGHPDSIYFDINLTRNDAGCYGGSFTLDNFFPNTANDWARVFMVAAPRRVLVNGTLDIKADGYDK